MKWLVIRPSIISGVLVNLAAGWFGIVLITPAVLINPSPVITIIDCFKAVISGVFCIYSAELLERKE